VKRPALGTVALGCFGLGAVLMLALEDPITRVLGIALLFAFIVAGVFAIAAPELLDGEEEEAG
jgi:hypothetical protein